MSFTPITGTGGGGAYVYRDKWGYQTAEKVRLALNDLDTRSADIEAVIPVGDIVGESDAQTLTNKTINGASNTLTVLAASQISGDLPFANLAQGSALSVLGVTGNATADNASIAAASDGQVLRRSGTAVAFGAVNLASSNAITGALPLANLPTGFAQVFAVTTTLTDAQVKALPTTPITIIAAPGAGLVLVPHLVQLFSDFSAGAYTNVDADGYMWLTWSTTNDFSNYLLNQTSPALTYLSDFLAAADRRVAFREWTDTTDYTNGFGSIAFSTGRNDNSSLRLSVSNGGSGNFTGGNAANVLKVVSYYSIEAAP